MALPFLLLLAGATMLGAGIAYGDAGGMIASIVVVAGATYLHLDRRRNRPGQGEPVRADQLQPGDTIVRSNGLSTRHGGKFPQVEEVRYRGEVENGQPLLEVTITDRWGAFYLLPGEQVEILREKGGQ